MKKKGYRFLTGILLAMFPLVANSIIVERIQHNEQYVYFCQPAGVNVLEKATGKWTAYTHQNGMLPVSQHSTITLHNDTLWVGSFDGWVTAINGAWKESKRYNTVVNKDDPDGLHFPVKKIAVGEQGRVGLQYAYGAAMIADGTEDYYDVSSEAYSAYGGRLHDIAIDHTGNLWIAGDMSDKVFNLCKYTYGAGIDYVILHLEKPWPSWFGPIRCVTIDDDNNVWLNSGNQLVKYDGTEYTPYEIKTQANDMAFDKQGRLWLAGEKGGLCRFANGETTFYPYQEETWNCLDIDGDVIYIGTQNGVLKFENGEFTPFDIPDLTTGITLSLASPKKSTGIYDLQGRRLTAQPTKGIYIQNGKKVVVK